MSFSAPSFGAAAKPGFSFGSNTTGTVFGAGAATPGFGTGGSFGSATPAPAFGAAAPFGGSTAGATAFGAPAASSFGGAAAAPAFGAATGNPAFGGATATPAFGATTGAPGFGTQPATSAFGANAAPAFGATQGATGFGAPAISGFGAGGGLAGFGATSTAPSFAAPSSVPAFGGGSLFGTTNTATTSSFNFGGAATSTAPASFGGGLFGGGSLSQPATSTAGFSGFGGMSSGLNTGFGGIGGFGAKPAGNLGFGAQQPFGQQQQQQPQQEVNPDVQFIQSIINVNLFNDERDSIIARFNHLQALWGTGKSYFSPNQPPIEITNHNVYNRFKTIAYCKISKKDNKMGLVGLVFNKKFAQIKDQQSQIVSGLHQLFGNKPNLTIKIENMFEKSDTHCQVDMYIEEKSLATNEVKRVLASEIIMFLNTPNVKQTLTNYGIEKTIALISPDDDQLKEYLESPPKGIDPRMWKQAQLDNPDPQEFLPVPIMGNNQLKWHIKCQENETEKHCIYLRKIENDLNELKKRHMNAAEKIVEHRRRIAKLSHTILKIIVKQETTRKAEEALLPEEEMIRNKLETIQSLVIPPNEFKGRLNELVAQMKIHLNQWYDTGMLNEYSLDEEAKDEMKTFLTMQQKAISVLIDTMKKDMKALEVINNGINQLKPVKP